MSADVIAYLRRVHAESSMVGWDFSRLDGRLESDDTPWDFDAECRAALVEATSAVDLGTGGGERLISHLRAVGAEAPRMWATEGWEPNLPVARAALAPWDVPVLEYDAERDDRLPLPYASVDVILNRHEAVDWTEFARILRPGGRLLTQQVAGDDAHELRDWFGGESLYPEVQAETYVAELEHAGFGIDVVEDWTGALRLRDVTTLVEYLAMVPWDVPDFVVDDHADALVRLAETRPITLSQRRFRIIATRR